MKNKYIKKNFYVILLLLYYKNYSYTYVIQSIIGHTERHKQHPVHSSVTYGMCFSLLKVIAWYPESLHAM